MTEGPGRHHREHPGPEDRPAGGRHVVRHLLDAVGGGLALAGVLGLVAHLVPFRYNLLIGVGAVSAWLMALAPVALVLFAVRRSWWPAAVAAALTLVVAALLAPTYRGVPAGAGAPLTVVTANLELGQADPVAIVREARRSGADVLLLQELTGGERDRLAAAGLDDLLPHSTVDARPGAGGVGLWSRHPLADPQRHGGFVFAAVSARVLLGGERPAPTVLTVHMPGPWPQPAGDWVRDVARLPALLSSVAAQADAHGGAVLVGGDLNATYGNAQFRRLLRGGYRDAAEQAGAQWTATYPADSRFVPPVIGIDHVLLRHARASGISTVPLPGSDHRGLQVRLRLGG